MAFNSMLFVVFFVVVATAYFLVPGRFRWCLLLPASYFFYMCWRVEYALLIITSTLVDYVAGLAMGRTSSPGRRTLLLLMSLVTNLGLLFTFKYFNFFCGSLRVLFDHLGLSINIPYLDVLLPVGISFYTFQTLSYTIDVYRRKVEPETHFGRFALYVSFFPQLVAGPIERAHNLLPQLRRQYRFDSTRVWAGLQLMIWGLFKKMVVADQLAIYADTVFGNVLAHQGLTYIVATYFFTWQVYCDFSGYSDIAIGAAKVLGIDLMKNFDRPYFVTHIADFWRRWHISLSTWLRDYLYFPLGGTRCRPARAYFNLFVTLLLAGVWHGAAWNLVFWGALHGFWICASRLTLPGRDRLVKRWGLNLTLVKCVRIVVFFHLFCLTMIIFRTHTLAEGFHVITHLFSGWPEIFVRSAGWSLVHGTLGILVLFVVQVLQGRGSLREALGRRSLAVRWAVYAAVLFSIVLFGVDGGVQFIYFQF